MAHTKSRMKARAKARAKARVRDAQNGVVRNPHAIENKALFHGQVAIASSGASGYHESKATRRARTRKGANEKAIFYGW